jgi:uncharacterized membrane protein (DUF485 family)
MQPMPEIPDSFVRGYSKFRLAVASFSLALVVNFLFIVAYRRLFLPANANAGNTDSFIWVFAYFGVIVFWPVAAFAFWIVSKSRS